MCGSQKRYALLAILGFEVAVAGFVGSRGIILEGFFMAIYSLIFGKTFWATWCSVFYFEIGVCD